MVSKVISKEDFKEEELYEEAVELAKEIKNRHTRVAVETAKLEKDKDRLKHISGDKFFRDILESEIPKVYTTHEFETPDGIVKNSFRFKSRPFDKINDKPAYEVLKRLFKSSTDDIFEVSKDYEITAGDSEKTKQFDEHPEFFTVSFREDLPVEKLKLMVKGFPELFELNVTDTASYAKQYPSSVEEKQKVTAKKGFLESVAEIDEEVRKKARKFLAGFLKSAVTSAVTCANGKKG